MDKPAAGPHVPESFLEHRQLFARSWVNQWVLPNPFISPLHEALRDYGVELADFSFTKDAANIGDTFLIIAIRRLNAAVRIGLDSIILSAANPDWSNASNLVGAFELVTKVTDKIISASPSLQETTLLLHLVDESKDLKAATANLVNTSLIGEASFYGISIQRNAGPLVIEKSLKYENAVFIRIQHKFKGIQSFTAIAA